MRPAGRPRYADLSIRVKLLAPFAILMLLWGGFGSYVLARGAAGEARGRATAMLASELNAARTRVADAERGLLEAVRLASHTQGMAQAIRDRDRVTLERLVLPIAVNASSLRFDVVDPRGRRLVGVSIDDDGRPTVERRGRVTGAATRAAARGEIDAQGDKWVDLRGDDLLVAGPVRDGRGRVVGAVAASRSLVPVLRMGDADDIVLTVHPARGASLSTGAVTLPTTNPTTGVLHSTDVGGESYEIVEGPLEARGEQIGSITAGIPSAVALGAAGATARNLALLVGIAVLLVVAIGLWTARAITRPLGSLMDATAALERGDLEARAAVDARDEVGRLADSFNAMAAELQTSHRELEDKVHERTAALEQANAELARVSEAKSTFLASMSHELRTPLNAIIGFADMLGDPTFGPVRARETRELAGNILVSGRHLLQLINDVLDLAKVEAGRIEVEPQAADIGAIVGEVMGVTRSLAEPKGHEVALTVKGTPPRVWADPGRTRQVLFNLMANAIKFTPEGGRITVEVAAGPEEVTISVIDTGPGLTRAEARAIFEPFERGKATRATEGAGLGLALAKHLVELQGGRITVTGVPGEGSTFAFTLPLAQRDAEVLIDA